MSGFLDGIIIIIIMYKIHTHPNSVRAGFMDRVMGNNNNFGSRFLMRIYMYLDLQDVDLKN